MTFPVAVVPKWTWLHLAGFIGSISGMGAFYVPVAPELFILVTVTVGVGVLLLVLDTH